LSNIPDDLAAELLAREYFVCLDSPASSNDWLADVTHLPTSDAMEGLFG
jgi:hypothetical protein